MALISNIDIYTCFYPRAINKLDSLACFVLRNLDHNLISWVAVIFISKKIKNIDGVSLTIYIVSLVGEREKN